MRNTQGAYSNIESHFLPCIPQQYKEKCLLLLKVGVAYNVQSAQQGSLTNMTPLLNQAAQYTTEQKVPHLLYLGSPFGASE